MLRLFMRCVCMGVWTDSIDDWIWRARKVVKANYRRKQCSKSLKTTMKWTKKNNHTLAKRFLNASMRIKMKPAHFCKWCQRSDDPMRLRCFRHIPKDIHTTAKHQLKIVSTFYYHCSDFFEDEHDARARVESERQKRLEIGIEIQIKWHALQSLRYDRWMALSAQLFWMNWYFCSRWCSALSAIKQFAKRDITMPLIRKHLIIIFFPFYYLYCVIVLNMRFDCLLDVFPLLVSSRSSFFFNYGIFTWTRRRTKANCKVKGSFRYIK